MRSKLRKQLGFINTIVLLMTTLVPYPSNLYATTLGLDPTLNIAEGELDIIYESIEINEISIHTEVETNHQQEVDKQDVGISQVEAFQL